MVRNSLLHERYLSRSLQKHVNHHATLSASALLYNWLYIHGHTYTTCTIISLLNSYIIQA